MPVFYESTNKTGIVDDAYFQTNTNSTIYPLGNVAFHANIGYGDVIARILRADKRWKWDDPNISEEMETTFNLVKDQGEYGFLSNTPAETYQDFNKVFGVAIKDDNGDWRNLDYITREMVKDRGIAWDEFEDTSGTPSYYFLEGTQLFLKPAPDYASAGGGKIYLQRNPEFFARTDTTKVPGFDQKYHYLLSLYIQRGWYMGKNPNMLGNIQALIDRGLREVELDYSRRLADEPKRQYYHANWK